MSVASWNKCHYSAGFFIENIKALLHDTCLNCTLLLKVNKVTATNTKAGNLFCRRDAL